MAGTSSDPYAELLAALESAGKEENRRQAFIAFAARAFGDSSLATDLALSAEYNVEFKKSGVVRRGSVDALYGNLVIEFENALAKTREHALDQLRNYVAGAWTEDKSTKRTYLAVATDGNRWETYSPRVRDAARSIDADNVELVPSVTCDFSNLEQRANFENFLNRLFYRSLTLTPSAANFARDFGLDSPAFKATEALLIGKVRELNSDPLYKTLFKEWTAHLQKAYGSLATDDELFIRHTYLATLARLLVWAALERRDPTPGDVRAVLDGTYFIGRGIGNLWEDDYFKWPSIPGPNDAVEGWQRLARQLSAYQLSAVKEDILKPLYEELVDPETRHDLGEFYTPDWLAQELTSELLDSWDYSTHGVPRVMDPTCGSGSFLRAILDHVKTNSSADLGKILDSVFGFDVHPLAVLVSRSTYVLAIQQLVSGAGHVVNIPVYLADSLTVRDIATQRSLLGGEDVVTLTVADKDFRVPEDFLLNAALFDETMASSAAVAKAFENVTPLKKDHVASSTRAKVSSRLAPQPYASELEPVLIELTYYLAQLVQQRRDSVYGFVLRNTYRPAMSRASVDFVIGNPPWLTIGDIDDSDYKAAIVRYVRETEIAPRKTGDQSHTDLATIFLSHVTRFYLDPQSPAGKSAQVAFVMPRSIFVGTQHANLRQGLYKLGSNTPGMSMNIEKLWDLDDVRPLFRVPACAVFASSKAASPSTPKPGTVFSGRLPAKDAAPSVAKSRLKRTPATFGLAFLARRSAWRRTDTKPLTASERHSSSSKNAYRLRIRQGAILYPQSLLIVRPQGKVPAARSQPVRVRTDEDAAKGARKCADVRLDRLVNGENLFLTAAADHIFPYVPRPDLWHVVIPSVASPGQPKFGSVDANQLRMAGRLETAAWLTEVEQHWVRARKSTEKTPLHERLDKYRQLSAQAAMRRYVVLYNASGGAPAACVLDVKKLPRPFVARDKTYWFSSASEDEAFYLAAFLNSAYAFDRIVDFMTRGLMGPRDIHKRILDVPWPPFDASSPDHRNLARISKALGSEASKALHALTGAVAGPFSRNDLKAKLPPLKLQGGEALVAKISSAV